MLYVNDIPNLVQATAKALSITGHTQHLVSNPSVTVQSERQNSDPLQRPFPLLRPLHVIGFMLSLGTYSCDASLPGAPPPGPCSGCHVLGAALRLSGALGAAAVLVLVSYNALCTPWAPSGGARAFHAVHYSTGVAQIHGDTAGWRVDWRSQRPLSRVASHEGPLKTAGGPVWGVPAPLGAQPLRNIAGAQSGSTPTMSGGDRSPSHVLDVLFPTVGCLLLLGAAVRGRVRHTSRQTPSWALLSLAGRSSGGYADGSGAKRPGPSTLASRPAPASGPTQGPHPSAVTVAAAPSAAGAPDPYAALIVDCGTGESKVLRYELNAGGLAFEELERFGPATEYLDDPGAFAARVLRHVRAAPADVVLVAASAWMRKARGAAAAKGAELLRRCAEQGVQCKVPPASLSPQETAQRTRTGGVSAPSGHNTPLELLCDVSRALAVPFRGR